MLRYPRTHFQRFPRFWLSIQNGIIKRALLITTISKLGTDLENDGAFSDSQNEKRQNKMKNAKTDCL